MNRKVQRRPTMNLEDKIDKIRYRAAAWLANWLKVFGFGGTASALLLANERFVCPLCALLREMRRKNPRLVAHFSKFCATCMEAVRGNVRTVLNCIVCVLRSARTSCLLADLYILEIWSHREIPIFLRNQQWLN